MAEEESPTKCAVGSCEDEHVFQAVWSSCKCPKRYKYYCADHFHEKVVARWWERNRCKHCSGRYSVYQVDSITRITL